VQVKSKTRWTIGISFFVAVLALGPPAIRTIQIASSADGLLSLASFSDEDFDWNPWSDNCYLIRQDMAVWLLSNYDWPYNSRDDLLRGSEPMPLINAALASRGLHGPGAFAVVEDRRMLLLMHVFIYRGESIEGRWRGYTPLQAAILQGDLQAVVLLVERGADLTALVEHPGKAMHGMNSLEFVELLYSKHPDRFDTIRQYLRQLSDFA